MPLCAVFPDTSGRAWVRRKMEKDLQFTLGNKLSLPHPKKTQKRTRFGDQVKCPIYFL